MEIELCGYKVLIDDEDYEKISAYSWKLSAKDKKNGYFYFMHSYKDSITGKNSHAILLHRLLTGCILKDGKVCDHKNGNTLDNRKCNLRVCTVFENAQNRKRTKINKTGYKGVCFNKRAQKYQAQISVNRKYIYLGLYVTPKEAHIAYCEASNKYHGEFGRTE